MSQNIMPIRAAHSPVAFYFWLRRLGYSPRNAAVSVFAQFCHSSDEYWERMDAIAKL